MGEKDYETWVLSHLGEQRRVVQWLVSRCRLRDCVPRETLHALSDTVSHRPWHIIITLCSSHQWESKSGWYWALHISYGGSGFAGSQAHSRQTDSRYLTPLLPMRHCFHFICHSVLWSWGFWMPLRWGEVISHWNILCECESQTWKHKYQAAIY